MERYLLHPIERDLAQKMVFLGGPRQVGKTYLAQKLLSFPRSRYLNWDRRQDRREILKADWPVDSALIILDELHKFARWKSFIKGEFDHFRDLHHFLVTGSARLDVYRKSGDSLQGRYHAYRMHPLSVWEILHPGPPPELPEATALPPLQSDQLKQEASEIITTLIKWGGFPEPFIAQSDRLWRRWRNERFDRFFREDLRDLERVAELSQIQLLAEIIIDKIGGLLSINSLREDLDVSHRAVTHWVEILERLYYLYRIRPYSNRKIRSLKKMPKVYLWDWSQVGDEGARFENMVAGHLLKFCHFREDYLGFKTELTYLRDPQEREVDFLVTSDGKPWFCVEAKLSETDISPALRYFEGQLEIPWLYQVVLKPQREYKKDKISVLSAARFLNGLGC